MNKSNPFEVKPLKRYDVARYPTFVPRPQEEQEEQKAHPLVIVLAVVLALGLSLGLVGCYSDYKHFCPDGLPPDRNGDCPDDEPECLPGQVVCRGDSGYSTCNADGETWANTDCEDYCRDMFGHDATVLGCDEQAAQPCQCEYDITLGIMAICTQGDVYCKDEATVGFCDYQTLEYDYQNCGEYCQETMGEDYYSKGCDAQASDPCLCEYDIIEGGLPVCTPGEFSCVDELTAQVCTTDYTWETRDCEVYCQETYGEYTETKGCVEGADDPCGCYDIIDGDVAECTPGEFLFCHDENTASVCAEDHWTWIYQDCAEYCVIHYGPDASSSGCDDNEGDNFCGCTT
jgi:hypothetical protein